MKRMLSCLGLAVLGLLVVAGSLWFFTVTMLDGRVKDLIEAEGSALLGVPVEVEDVRIELRRKRATLSGIRIANPPGFASGTALTLAQVDLEVSTESEFSRRHLVLRDVQVRSPEVHCIIDERGRSNISVLQDNIAKAREQRGTAPASGGSSTVEGLSLIVERLRIEPSQIDVEAPALKGEGLRIELEEVIMEELGAPDGAPLAVIADQVLSTLISKSSRAVAKRGLLDLVEQKLGEGAKELGRGLLKKVFGEK